ncbi:MAG: hypothetical protein V3U75_04245 [Methylococcaceae bacterium]
MGDIEIECEICGGVVKVREYGDGECNDCGREYKYDEGYFIKLTEEDKELLRQSWRNSRKSSGPMRM